MEPQHVDGWKLMTGDDATIMRWQHEDYDIWMTVSHQPDHYNDDGEQVMRWHSRATLGKNITVGEHEFFLCEELGCDTAKSGALNWAYSWMTDDFQQFLDGLNNPNQWKLDG